MRNNKLIIVGKRGDFLSILIPAATVFISSFCVMALELAAGRLVAKELGFSLYTWTAVIGVILAGITVGYYISGRIADRFDAKKALAALFALSSAACVLTIILNNTVGEWLWLWYLGWPMHIFTHVILVFLLPSMLLGMISPVVAKMALDKGLPQGRTVGDIYAWGAAGSIAGTFAAGFYLIPAIGTIPLVWMIGGVLALLAIICRVRLWAAYIWLAAFVLIFTIAAAPMQWCQTTGRFLMLREPVDPKVIYKDESQYCYIAVKQLSVVPDRRIFMQDTLLHSTIIMGAINDLQYDYEVIYAGLTHLMSVDMGGKLSVMFIGGGGYVFPRYIENNWPGSIIDVVEIDPRVTRAAIAAFGLEPNSPINTITMDARNYVDGLLEKKRNGGQTPKYDFIYEDAFNDYSVPYQLVTREFNDKIAGLLTDNGIYMINMIDTYNSGLFLGALINTLQKTFPHVYVTTNSATHYPSVRETFVVAASKKPIDIEAVDNAMRLKLWHPNEAEMNYLVSKSRGIVLTDDYVPVENLLTSAVREGSRERLAMRYLDDAKSLKARGKWSQSIEAFENALRLNPTMSILAYNEIGLMQAEHNNPQEAARAFKNAIDFYNRTENTSGKIIGSLYLNLGMLLGQMGQNEESGRQLKKAVEEFRLELDENPNSSETWSRLGDALAATGDFNSASDAFTKAVSLAPDNISNWYGLAKTLEFQDRLAEAIDVVKRAINRSSDNEQTKTVLDEYLVSLEQKSSKQKK
jgi:tetratricopeptide (TPR) repeat protein/MFS family permease